MRYDPDAALEALRTADPAKPFVIGQLGQSLDGRIATPTGKSKYISGRRALEHLHRLRASVDAVVVGVSTVIADDPQLTVRMVDGRSPARVVIDPRDRLPRAPRCQARGPERLIVIREAANADPNGRAGQIDVIPIEGDDAGALPPERIVAALHERGLSRILIEGGSTTLSHALNAGVIDSLHVMVAPVILGSGKPGLQLPPIDGLEEGLHPAVNVSVFDDGDVLFACDLRRSRRPARVDVSTPRAADAPAERTLA